VLKRFYFLLGLALILNVLVLIDFFSSRKGPKVFEQKMAKMTNLATPALGVSWYEPRIIGLDKDENRVFFDMPSPNRLNFLYSW